MIHLKNSAGQVKNKKGFSSGKVERWLIFVQSAKIRSFKNR